MAQEENGIDRQIQIQTRGVGEFGTDRQIWTKEIGEGETKRRRDELEADRQTHRQTDRPT